MKSKKRITLLAVLVCLFALVLSLGILGACGNDGENGGTATAGGSYLYGTTAPDEGLGKAGDYYLDTETLSAYVKTADGEWVQTALYSGTGAPDANEGKQGDLYLDTTGGVLYQKGESLWSIVLKVKGRDGVVWFSGSKEPTDPENETLLQGAMKGDFYLDTTKFHVWQLGEDGQWNWLGSIKGDKGDDSVHVFYGTGVPEGNSSVEGAVDGDLYFGTFDGFEVDDEGAGTVLYRYNEDGTWEELMSDRKEGQINIRTAEQLKKFAASVTAENSYKDREVHLKADIDLSEALAKASVFETIENTWTPIGTSDAPFEGTFDGEGHTISNLTAAATGTNGRAGFFGYVDGATIEHLKFSNAEVTASGEGSYGAVVVCEAGSNGATFTDVTVESSSVEAKDGGAKVGGLVGKAAGTITVQEVDVEVKGVKTEESGNEGNSLVGEGEVNFKGENDIIYDLAEGFVEKHHKSGEETAISYGVSSAEGLKAFRDSVNGGNPYEGKTVCLDAGVDLGNEPWDPIGTVADPFTGVFDGQGNKIKNLKVVDGNEYSGLFGMVGKFGDGHEGAIENLNLENADVFSSKDYAGSVAGNLRGNISGVHVTGNITVRGNGKYVAGIVGHAYSDISDCSVEGSGSVTIEGRGSYTAGGIVGWLSGNVANCTVTGITITAPVYAGGIAGQAAETACKFTGCSVRADVRITMETDYPDYGATVGGIIGVPDKGNWNSGSGSPAHSDIPEESIVYTIENCSFEGKLFKGSGLAATAYYGLSGHDPVKYQAVVRIADSSLKMNTEDVGMNIFWSKLYHFEDKFHNKATLNTAGGTAELYTRTGLEFFRDAVNIGADFAGVTVSLHTNVDFGGENWLPIGCVAGYYQKRDAKTNELYNKYGNYEHYFRGVFDGMGHSISNVVIDRGSDVHRGAQNAEDPNEYTDQNQGVGFFGYVGTNASYLIDNTLTAENEGVELNENWGKGSISNLSIDQATVAGRRAAGVLAGWVMGGDFGVSNVTVSDSTVDSSHWVAGLVGYFNGARGRITDCKVENTTLVCLPHNEWEYNEGARYTGDKAGALGGQLAGEDFTVTGCKAVGVRVSAFRDVGGLIGHLNTKTFTVNGNSMEDVTVTLDQTVMPCDVKEQITGALNPNYDLFVGRLEDGVDREAFKTGNAMTDDCKTERKK